MAPGTQPSTAFLVRELLLGTLTWLSPEGRCLVRVLVSENGRPISPHQVASALGLRNRHQLARLLVRENLPSQETLAGWIRIAFWVVAWEAHGTALAQTCLRDGDDPAVRFRTVRRLTGCTWSELRTRGSLWVALELRGQCRARESKRPVIRQTA